jgi:hypothetical protein
MQSYGQVDKSQQAAKNPETNNHTTGPTKPTPNPARTKRHQGEQASSQEWTKQPGGDQPEEKKVETSDIEASPQLLRKKWLHQTTEKGEKNNWVMEPKNEISDECRFWTSWHHQSLKKVYDRQIILVFILELFSSNIKLKSFLRSPQFYYF